MQALQYLNSWIPPIIWDEPSPYRKYRTTVGM